ncbi:hypothetical protein RJ639_022352 [Escallonia herrerae]|uniref:Uncharacterized protein n=1 Tax=Escallonia herrerae TaxID=1293975 RepID=A0AA88V3Y9_9ASTE|nr:hypothetical protein RJ639_022352 [Escallonia herrerae]
MFLWSGSTNSFHFYCGPMAPTLQDVAALTGLHPHGDRGHAAMVYEGAKYYLPTEKIWFGHPIGLGQTNGTRPFVIFSSVQRATYGGREGFERLRWSLLGAHMWLHGYLPELAPMPAPNDTEETWISLCPRRTQGAYL